MKWHRFWVISSSDGMYFHSITTFYFMLALSSLITSTMLCINMVTAISTKENALVFCKNEKKKTLLNYFVPEATTFDHLWNNKWILQWKKSGCFWSNFVINLIFYLSTRIEPLPRKDILHDETKIIIWKISIWLIYSLGEHIPG